MRALLKLTIVMAVAILAIACGASRPEVVHLTPSQQAIRESPEEVRIREAAALIAEQEQIEKDKKAVAALDTSEERKVRKDLAKAEARSRKYDEKVEKTIQSAAIEGCDPATMRIHPDAVPHHTLNSFVKVRVFNTEKVPIDIKDSGKIGVMVENLCPGGSMFIFRNRSLQSSIYTNFSFVAEGRYPNGDIRYSQSDYQLSRYDWSNGGGQQERIWFVKLQPR